MDTNKVALKIAKEESSGVLPANPKFMELRNTGMPGFGSNPSTIQSNEIRPDRQVADLVTVGAEPGGTIDMELSYGSFDMLFEGAFQREFESKPSIINETGEIVGIVSNEIEVSANGENFKTGNLVKLSGFGTENDGVKVVASSTATTIIISDSLADQVDVPVGATIKMVGSQGAVGDISITADADEKSLNSLALDFSALGLQPGEWIKIGGSSSNHSFATADNNAYVRVNSVSASKIVLGFTPLAFTTDTGDGKTIRLFMGDMLKNAEKITDLTRSEQNRTFTVEQSFLDHKPIDYQYVSGMLVDSLSMTLSSANFIEMSVGMQGSLASISNTRMPNIVDVLAPQNPVLNTSSNIAQIARGDAKIEGANYVSELSVEINNNARRRNAVGVFGTQSIGVGEFAVTGSMSTYFSNSDLLKTLIDNEETALNYVVKDNNKQAYFFDFPRVKYTSGNPEVSGKNEDVMLDLEYQAIRDAELGYTMSIVKFDYVE